MPHGRQHRTSPRHRAKPSTVRPQAWTCIFVDGLSKEADDQVQREWKETRGEGAPFGSLRKSFREQHCATLNPYGSDQCPYPPTACVLAFLVSVQRSLSAEDPRVYFRVVTKSLATQRADTKPLSRDSEPHRTQASYFPDVTRDVAAGSDARRSGDLGGDGETDRIPLVAEAAEGHLHRRIARPVHVSAVLGIPASRPRSPANGVEGSRPERPEPDDGNV